jgi:hypothetical protein
MSPLVKPTKSSSELLHLHNQQRRHFEASLPHRGVETRRKHADVAGATTPAAVPGHALRDGHARQLANEREAVERPQADDAVGVRYSDGALGATHLNGQAE